MRFLFSIRTDILTSERHSNCLRNWSVSRRAPYIHRLMLCRQIQALSLGYLTKQERAPQALKFLLPPPPLPLLKPLRVLDHRRRLQLSLQMTHHDDSPERGTAFISRPLTKHFPLRLRRNAVLVLHPPTATQTNLDALRTSRQAREQCKKTVPGRGAYWIGWAGASWVVSRGMKFNEGSTVSRRLRRIPT